MNKIFDAMNRLNNARTVVEQIRHIHRELKSTHSASAEAERRLREAQKSMWAAAAAARREREAALTAFNVVRDQVGRQ